jgi:hypothetical protein
MKTKKNAVVNTAAEVRRDPMMAEVMRVIPGLRENFSGDIAQQWARP